MIYIGQIDTPSLKDILDAVATPHIDLAPLFRTDGPLRVDVDALQAILDHGEPSIHFSYEDGTLTVQKIDGGVMATLEVKI